MAKCPKCGLDFSVPLKKCPNCLTTISPIKKETKKDIIKDIIDLPKLKSEVPLKVEEKIENKVDILKEIEKDKDINGIKVKQIPLKVKKVESHYNDFKDMVPSSDVFKGLIEHIKFVSIIKGTMAVVLFILNCCLIFDITFGKENTEPQFVIDEEVVEKISEDISLSGFWKTQNDGLFLFQDDNKFYWYDNYGVRDDNYYGGSYNYKRGLEALEEMGYTEEEFYKEFTSEINLNNVYSLNLQPLLSYKFRKDNTVNDLNENESWWFLVIINNDNTAFGYNKTLDLRYNLEKAS